MLFNIEKVSWLDNNRIQTVRETLVFLKQEYPDFFAWFNAKVIPGLEDNSRQIYIARPMSSPNSVAGIMILKDEPDEKKISTLCVMEQYRSYGLGSKFINLAIETLHSLTPIITVSELHRNEFEPLLKKYSFKHFKEYFAYYRDNVSEHSYNGYLTSSQKKHDMVSAS